MDLQGLGSASEAAKVTAKLLTEKRPAGTKPPTPLHPFDKDSLKLILKASDGNPRRFLETLDTVLNRAKSAGTSAVDKMGVLELTFVKSLVDESATAFAAGKDQEDEDDLANPLH